MEQHKLATAPEVSVPQSVTASPAIIRQLIIDRFRGIKHLKWNPATGLNVLLGGGDVGKTTILEAISLLLNPSNSAVVSESDYYDRSTSDGFVIQAVLSIPLSTGVGQHQKLSWPWEWNGKDAVPPLLVADDKDDIPTAENPVYRLQVRATNELELAWEIVQPNDEVDILSSAVRRAIGILRLANDDRNDRDLRLVYGSALERLLADQALKAKIGQLISELDFHGKLSTDAKSALGRLEEALEKGSLPSKLALGLTSSQGISLGALIGLHVYRPSGTCSAHAAKAKASAGVFMPSD